MPKIMLALAPPHKPDRLAALLKDETGAEPTLASTGREALALARENSYDLVILEENLPDMSYLEAVKDLLGINAFINTAVLTDLPEEEFHEQSEGLGILSGISTNAGQEEVRNLLDRLKEVSG